MLRFRTLSFRVVHKHTAASSSTSPCSTGQHSLTTGSPRPMCTNPPRRSTQAPSLRVSIGHVAGGGGRQGRQGLGGGGGQGLVVGGLVTGGTVTGGRGLIGGRIPGGRVMGGFTIGGRVTGGRVTGGLGIGGRVTGGLTVGGTVTGGLTMGGTVTGGLMGGTMPGGRVIGGLTMGGRVMGPLGGLTLPGLCFGGWPQMPQPRMGVVEEMNSMEMKRRAVNLDDSILVYSLLRFVLQNKERNGLGW
ncbi:unnamed protein product [Camellia sinensis]